METPNLNALFEAMRVRHLAVDEIAALKAAAERRALDVLEEIRGHLKRLSSKHERAVLVVDYEDQRPLLIVYRSVNWDGDANRLDGDPLAALAALPAKPEQRWMILDELAEKKASERTPAYLRDIADRLEKASG